MSDPIKAKIQELCPDVKGGCRKHVDYSHDECFSCRCSVRNITLAVVLRTIMRVKMSSNANFKPVPGGVTVPFLDAENLAYYWDLMHDNYDQQSEETKAFIGSLLTNEK